MILMTRVDERLLHGMVAVSWTSQLLPEVIVVVNDDVANDEFSKMTYEMAKPSGVMLRVFTKDEFVDKYKETSLKDYKVFVIVNSIQDARYLTKKLGEEIMSDLNIAPQGISNKEGLVNIHKEIRINQDDFQDLEYLNNIGVNVFGQVVPSGEKINFVEIKQIFKKMEEEK